MGWFAKGVVIVLAFMSIWSLTIMIQKFFQFQRSQAVLDALTFKCDVLWAQLDALYAAYVEPGMIPPGAFRPEAP
jgi:pyrroloquinoline quinone (PQQ) biosynthesis protein C